MLICLNQTRLIGVYTGGRLGVGAIVGIVVGVLMAILAILGMIYMSRNFNLNIALVRKGVFFSEYVCV